MLDQWLDWASRSRLAPFVKLARTIRKHAVGILAYLDTRMTNGPVEGINNKLRVIARRAYGFHSHGARLGSTCFGTPAATSAFTSSSVASHRANGRLSTKSSASRRRSTISGAAVSQCRNCTAPVA